MLIANEAKLKIEELHGRCDMQARYFFFFDEQANIYKKGLEAAKHTGRIRDYQPLKQKTRQPNPYLEANFCSLGTLCAF